MLWSLRIPLAVLLIGAHLALVAPALAVIAPDEDLQQRQDQKRAELEQAARARAEQEAKKAAAAEAERRKQAVRGRAETATKGSRDTLGRQWDKAGEEAKKVRVSDIASRRAIALIVGCLWLYVAVRRRRAKRRPRRV